MRALAGYLSPSPSLPWTKYLAVTKYSSSSARYFSPVIFPSVPSLRKRLSVLWRVKWPHLHPSAPASTSNASQTANMKCHLAENGQVWQADSRHLWRGSVGTDACFLRPPLPAGSQPTRQEFWQVRECWLWECHWGWDGGLGDPQRWHLNCLQPLSFIGEQSSFHFSKEKRRKRGRNRQVCFDSWLLFCLFT